MSGFRSCRRFSDAFSSDLLEVDKFFGCVRSQKACASLMTSSISMVLGQGQFMMS